MSDRQRGRGRVRTPSPTHERSRSRSRDRYPPNDRQYYQNNSSRGGVNRATSFRQPDSGRPRDRDRDDYNREPPDNNNGRRSSMGGFGNRDGGYRDRPPTGYQDNYGANRGQYQNRDNGNYREDNGRGGYESRGGYSNGSHPYSNDNRRDNSSSDMGRGRGRAGFNNDDGGRGGNFGGGRRDSIGSGNGRDNYDGRGGGSFGGGNGRDNYGGRGGGGFGGGRGGGRGGGANNYQPPRDQNQNIELYTNYIELVNNPQWVLYQYHVDFEPTIESRRLKSALINQHNQLFNNTKAFDGMTLYTPNRLPNPVTEVESTRKFDSQVVKISIRFTSEVRPNSREGMRLMNIVFRRCLLYCDYTEFGRDRAYYNFNERELHHIASMGLKVASGYKTAMDLFEGERILLYSELCHKLINFKTVWEIMGDIYQRERDPAEWRRRCIEELVGQTVMTNYNKKTYRIDDINFDLRSKDAFKLRNGEQISFVDYYFKNYQLKIRDPDQVMLVSRPRRRNIGAGAAAANNEEARDQAIMLVPEFCVVTGKAVNNKSVKRHDYILKFEKGTTLLQPFKNNFAVKRELDGITKLNPERRRQMLRDLMYKISNTDKARDDLAKWGMEFNSDEVKVNALHLKTVAVHFYNKQIAETDRGWDNAIRDGVALNSARLKNWSLFFPPRDDRTARNFMSELIRLAANMGFEINPPQMIQLPDSRGPHFANAIRRNIQESDPQIVVCIVSNKDKSTYDAIKRTCCVELGVPSQCVTSAILNSHKQNTVMSVITKVAVQINCKLGGEIWGVHIPKKNMMVVGMDVFKDSSQTNKSVAAFISSLNGNQDNKLNCTRYYSKCQIEPRESVFGTGLQAFMKGALLKYREVNGTFPSYVLVYRDGVSDGQFDVVREMEIPQLKRAFLEVDTEYKPNFSFIVVQKRGNTRLFMKDAYGNFTNPPIGSVVSKTITKSDNEFYLVSQSTNQGTVNPTHFHILEDDIEKNNNFTRLQSITYTFTHLYYNWPGQLRVPAPCHYAQKLARLVGDSLHEVPSPRLDDKLFYL